jgi:hypothetical protein
MTEKLLQAGIVAQPDAWRAKGSGKTGKTGRAKRVSLIQNQAHRGDLQAALLSVALSSRFAAANASACQVGIVPVKVFPVWVHRDGFHHPAHSQPHTTDARLTIHLVRVPRYPVKVLHQFYSDTFQSRL